MGHMINIEYFILLYIVERSLGNVYKQAVQNLSLVLKAMKLVLNVSYFTSKFDS